MSSIAARLERLPFSSFHKRLLLMGGLGYCFDAMDLAVIAFVLPMLMKEWSLDGVAAGVLISSSYIGYFVGAFGFLAAALLGYFIVPIGDWGWRIALAITALPVVMLLWWRRALPESPRWLVSQERHAEAEQILSRVENEIIRWTAKPLPQPAPLPDSVSSPAAVAQKASVFGSITKLGSRPLRPITAMTWLLWLSITFSYYSFFTWMPTLMVQKGMTISQSFGYSIGIYAAQIPGYYSAAYFNDRIGRRATIVGYMLLACASALTLAVALSTSWYVLAGVLLSLFMNGTYAGVYAYTSEVFPTPIRATGAGAASAIGRIGAICAPILVGAAFPLWGFAGVFGITTGMLCLGATSVLVLGISTHNQSLEAIVADELKV